MEIVKKFFHNTWPFFWAFPSDKENTGDYFQPCIKCRYCDYNVTIDSTGSWFHLPSKSLENHLIK